ncbi:MAG: hypothetical protein IKC59_05825 [Clostridia bacterium]|nr:hypothetical protein [Clostridia bacterium]
MKAKKIRRILALFCSACILLSGCGKRKDEAIPVDPVTLASSGASEYVIVRGNNADKSVVTAASDLWTAFNEKTGAKIDLCDEYRYAEKGGSAAIVVGTIGDEVSQNLKRDLRCDDFIVRIDGKNLYLVGGTDAATVNAVKWFIENYLKESVETLSLPGDFDMQYRNPYHVQNLTVAGNDISSYQIIYDADLHYSKACAQAVSDLIAETCGIRLEAKDDTAPETEHEILVGATNREESQGAIDAFELPNLYYSATVVGSKMVVANEGVRTGDAVIAAIKKHLSAIQTESHDLTSENFKLSGNVKSTDRRAYERVEGTDIRVMQSNVLGTIRDRENGYTDQQRLELLVDTYLFYMPDVITFNELHNNRDMLFRKMKAMLETYYTFVEAEYLDLFPEITGSTATCSTLIAYRNGADLTVLDAGYSYLSDAVNYHGAQWAVFETADGNRFLVTAVHLSQNTDKEGNEITAWAEDVMEIVNVAREDYGDLPVVMGGDWYFGKGWYGEAYDYIIEQGFDDASEVATNKYSPAIGTSHTIGIGKQDGVEQDLIFINPQWFKALSHKIVVDFYTVNSSDHYPVFADLQFLKSSGEGDIPVMPDGDEHLGVEDESEGCVGSWEDGSGTLSDGEYDLLNYQHRIKVYGRSADVENGIACDFSGAGIEFNATLSGDVVLKVYSNGTSYYTLYVNGVRQEQRVAFTSGTKEYTIATGLAEGTYNIKLIKQTQAEHSISTFMSLKMNGYFGDKPTDSELLIEFAGDSITCGYGTYGYPTEGVTNYGGAAYMDATAAYSYKTAQLLNADHSLISLSGWSILPNANGGASIPNIYGKTSYRRSDDAYAPSRTADIVVIHLGTNDLFSRDNYESDFVNASIAFIEQVKAMNPNTKIVWAYGSMMSGSNLTGFEAKVNAILNHFGGETAGMYSVRVPTNTAGAGKHPTEAAHTETAQVLADFITNTVLK